jgi:ribonuclease BN (tRNA processing enzyme)
MEWIVLGTGTHVPSADRGSASHLLCDCGKVALFDCGTGAKDRIARAGVAFHQISHIFVTHAHLDHWADLISLLFHRANAPARPKLTIVAPPGFYAMLQQLTVVVSWSLIDPDVAFVEPQHLVETDWFSVRAFAVSHGKLDAFAYRIETRAGTLCYSGDTGPCEGLNVAADKADLLVCECSLPASAGVVAHMTPEDVRALAERSRPGLLVLTHLYPDVLQPGVIESAFEGYAGAMKVGSDGLRVALAQPPGMKMIG